MSVHPAVELKTNPGSDTTWVWSADDYSEGSAKKETFAMRFKTVESTHFLLLNGLAQHYSAKQIFAWTCMLPMMLISDSIPSDYVFHCSVANAYKAAHADARKQNEKPQPVKEKEEKKEEEAAAEAPKADA
jgi:hypothetical protein